MSYHVLLLIDSPLGSHLCGGYGAGVDKDYEKAYRWFQQAAKGGHPKAQYWTGYFFAKGKAHSNNMTRHASYVYCADNRPGNEEG